MAVPAPLLRPHVAYLGAVALILALLLRYGWDAVWLAYGIHPLQPAFADLRTIQAGLDSLRHGLDPQLLNPTDPWHRPMNYPSVWLHLARALHWENERSYLVFAGLSVAAFLGCCADLIRRWPSWWTVVLALSQAPALMAERANNDCVIFALLYLSAISARPLFALLVPLSSLLKIYPVLALPAFAARRGPLLLAGLLCAAALLALIPELGAIRGATPVSPTVSFGLPVYALALAGAGLSLPPLAVGALLVLLAGLAALAFARRPVPEAEPAALRLFLCGGAVFLGSSLLGANWDYRLCFLLMTLPWLTQLPQRGLAAVLVALMLAACNQPLLEAHWGLGGLRLNLAAKAALFVLVAPLAWRAVPRHWLRLAPSKAE